MRDKSAPLIAVLEQTLFLTAPIALGFGGAFVVVLFALGDAEFDLHAALWLKYITNGTSVIP